MSGDGREQRVGVLVCSPLRLYREGLADALGRHSDRLEVVGLAPSASGLLEFVEATGAGVVVLDASHGRAAADVGRLRAARPDIPVVALGTSEDEREVVGLAEAGVAALVTRDQSLEELCLAVAAVTRGEAMCTPRTAATLLRRMRSVAAARTGSPRLEHLTPRELEVLELIAEGCSNKEIAGRLRIELATVKNHVHNILEKLGTSRRGQAVALLRAGAD